MSKNLKNKLMKIVNIDVQNLCLLSDLRNFNDIFRKDVTYDIKKTKKTGPPPLSNRYIFGKVLNLIRSARSFTNY